MVASDADGGEPGQGQMTAADRSVNHRTTAKEGVVNGVRRLLRLRLVIPVLRSRHPPEYTARGVAVGLIIAMTPTVGVQMAIVAVLWLLMRWLRPVWDFNVVAAMAWTWVTNVFTVAPFYYLFLVTGKLLLGQGLESASYEAFSAQLGELLATEASWWASLWIYAAEIFTIWGVPMFLGSIPWALICGWLGYRWSITLARAVHTRRRNRRGWRRRRKDPQPD